MNDIVLAALTNLFALFVQSMRIDHERGKRIVQDNLSLFCAEKVTAQYVELYETLCDMYELDTPDYEQSINTIIGKLKGEIPVEEQTLLLLRFMELACTANGTFDIENMFRRVIANIGLRKETCDDIRAFFAGQRTERVGIGSVEGIDGQFTVLILKEFNLVLVSYDGNEALTLNEMPLRPHAYMIWPRNGIIKSRNAVPIYHTPFMSQLFGSGEAYQQSITFSGRNIEFRFPNSANGLHNFSFDLHNGQLVAIMGGSGVGKSTLLNILNGTLRPDSGQVLINGRDLYEEKNTSFIGFVPQDDLLIEELTVWQNLLFTARFCFGNESDERLKERVTNCLSDLDLFDIKDLKVGSPLNKTISGGQRKRLNIALELIREPSILFLDEPTSGLSSADSERIIHLLKKQTYNGRLVVANVHQPSSDIYKLFDHLWLLDRGGYPIYNGNPIEAITYFKTAAHWADADSAVCPTCGNVTPEVILDIIDAKALDSNGRITSRRKVKPEEWHARWVEHANSPITGLNESTANINESTITSPEIATTTQQSAFKQFIIYLQRTALRKLADRQFLCIALLEAPLLAAVVAWLTRYSGEHSYTLFDNRNLLSYYFMAIIVSIFMGMSLTAEEIFRDRTLLKRERFLHLSYHSYISSKIVMTAIMTAIQTLLFILVGNTLIGIRDLFLVWWGILFSSAFLAGLTGLFLSRTMKSVVAIYITIPILLIPQILLCGVVVPFEDLDSHSRTGNVPLIGDIIPSRWAFEALAVTTFTDNKYNRHFFDLKRGQSELQIFREGYLNKMRSTLEDMRYHRECGDKDYNYAASEALLNKNAAYICNMFNIAQPQGDFNTWLNTTDEELLKRSKRWTRALDQAKKEWIKAHGQQELINLQRMHTNKKLEQTLTGENTGKIVRIEDDAIVPQMGIIYLDPKTHDGRAPFYSHVKLLGPWRIGTLWFNLGVLWLMSFITMIVIYSRKVR